MSTIGFGSIGLDSNLDAATVAYFDPFEWPRRLRGLWRFRQPHGGGCHVFETEPLITVS